MAEAPPSPCPTPMRVTEVKEAHGGTTATLGGPLQEVVTAETYGQYADNVYRVEFLVPLGSYKVGDAVTVSVRPHEGRPI